MKYKLFFLLSLLLLLLFVNASYQRSNLSENVEIKVLLVSQYYHLNLMYSCI